MEQSQLGKPDETSRSDFLKRELAGAPVLNGQVTTAQGLAAVARGAGSAFFGNYLTAAVDTVVFGGSYSDNLAYRRQREAEIKARAPDPFLAGEIVGTIAPIVVTGITSIGKGAAAASVGDAGVVSVSQVRSVAQPVASDAVAAARPTISGGGFRGFSAPTGAGRGMAAFNGPVLAPEGASAAAEGASAAAEGAAAAIKRVKDAKLALEEATANQGWISIDGRARVIEAEKGLAIAERAKQIGVDLIQDPAQRAETMLRLAESFEARATAAQGVSLFNPATWLKVVPNLWNRAPRGVTRGILGAIAVASVGEVAQHPVDAFNAVAARVQQIPNAIGGVADSVVRASQLAGGELRVKTSRDALRHMSDQEMDDFDRKQGRPQNLDQGLKPGQSGQPSLRP